MNNAKMEKIIKDECFKKAAELVISGYSQGEVETYMNGAVWGVELVLEKFMKVYIDDVLKDNTQKHNDVIKEAKDKGFVWF